MTLSHCENTLLSAESFSCSQIHIRCSWWHNIQVYDTTYHFSGCWAALRQLPSTGWAQGEPLPAHTGRSPRRPQQLTAKSREWAETCLWGKCRKGGTQILSKLELSFTERLPVERVVCKHETKGSVITQAHTGGKQHCTNTVNSVLLQNSWQFKKSDWLQWIA